MDDDIYELATIRIYSFINQVLQKNTPHGYIFVLNPDC